MSGCNGNQNGYVLAAGGRSTSRVLAPPGGHSSISFGSSSPPHQRPPPKQNNNNSAKSSGSSSALPPKPVKGASGGGRSSQGIGAIDQGDSLDRIMRPAAIPGLENHYSKSDRNHSNESSSSSTFQRGAQRSLGRNEYAEVLRKQIETKKEMDTQSERSQRRAYSGDFTSSNSLATDSRGRHNGPQKALAANEYAESLRAQIALKNTLNGNSDTRSNPRNQVKAYSAPEPTRGRGSVPPGGHSTFTMSWE